MLLGPDGPVVIDLDGDGRLNYTQQWMDVNLDGRQDYSGWTGRGDGRYSPHIRRATAAVVMVTATARPSGSSAPTVAHFTLSVSL